MTPFRANVGHYVGHRTETIIIEALRLYAAFKHMPPNEKSRAAKDYADALENDTWLVETTAPPA